MKIDPLNVYWEGLVSDMERWQDQMPEDTAIRHHIGEFRTFFEGAREPLFDADPGGGGCEAPDDPPRFKTRVVGALASQWMLLHQVASQRLGDSPYQEDLGHFDRQAGSEYRRLSHAFGVQTREHLSESLPLVYIGSLKSFSFWRLNGPAMLALSLSAPYDEASARLLSSGVSHAVLEQLPGLVAELRLSVHRELGLDEPDRQTRILNELVLRWLHQILIDLCATALGKLDFAESTLWPGAFVDDMASIADAKQLPFCFRPYVHLQALKYLKVDGIGQFEEQVREEVGPRLECRLKFPSAVTLLPLRAVQEKVDQVVEAVLDAPLQALGGESVGAVLMECAQEGATSNPEGDLRPWRKLTPEEYRRFVLDDLHSAIRTLVCDVIWPCFSTCH
jgi:hypothetical protein